MIKTNRRPRWLWSLSRLTPEERAEFDYLPQDQYETLRLFQYEDTWYDVGNLFLPTPPDLAGWDAIRPLAGWHGIVIRLVDNDRVVAGHYYAD